MAALATVAAGTLARHALVCIIARGAVLARRSRAVVDVVVQGARLAAPVTVAQASELVEHVDTLATVAAGARLAVLARGLLCALGSGVAGA